MTMNADVVAGFGPHDVDVGSQSRVAALPVAVKRSPSRCVLCSVARAPLPQDQQQGLFT
jgi:hypothetical protein